MPTYYCTAVRSANGKNNTVINDTVNSIGTIWGDLKKIAGITLGSVGVGRGTDYALVGSLLLVWKMWFKRVVLYLKAIHRERCPQSKKRFLAKSQLDGTTGYLNQGRLVP